MTVMFAMDRPSEVRSSRSSIGDGYGGDEIVSLKSPTKQDQDLVDQLFNLQLTSPEAKPVPTERLFSSSVSKDVVTDRPSRVPHRANGLLDPKDNYRPNRGRFWSGRSASTGTSMASSTPSYLLKGPNDKKITELCNRTGYLLMVTPRQRMYGCPPPAAVFPAGWKEPGTGCQVFVGKIPKQLFEDTLVPLFESVAPLYGMRLMMEGAPSVVSRGFAFVIYMTPDDAIKAEKELDGRELLPGRKIKVAVSEPIRRLVVTNIPRDKTSEEIQINLTALFPGVVTVTVEKPTLASSSSTDVKNANTGLCYVEFTTHVEALFAKKRLSRGAAPLCAHRVKADWADPIILSEESAARRATSDLYVQGLPEGISYMDLFTLFSKHGQISKIKLIEEGSRAYVHMASWGQAKMAVNGLNGITMKGRTISVAFALHGVTNWSTAWNPLQIISTGRIVPGLDAGNRRPGRSHHALRRRFADAVVVPRPDSLEMI